KEGRRFFRRDGGTDREESDGVDLVRLRRAGERQQDRRSGPLLRECLTDTTEPRAGRQRQTALGTRPDAYDRTTRREPRRRAEEGGPQARCEEFVRLPQRRGGRGQTHRGSTSPGLA